VLADRVLADEAPRRVHLRLHDVQQAKKDEDAAADATATRAATPILVCCVVTALRSEIAVPM
jgi:hypothetical protein